LAFEKKEFIPIFCVIYAHNLADNWEFTPKATHQLPSPRHDYRPIKARMLQCTREIRDPSRKDNA